MIVVVFSLISNPAFAVYEKLSIKNSHKSILKGEKFTLYGELKDRNLKPIRSAEITIWEKDKTNQKQLGVFRCPVFCPKISDCLCSNLIESYIPYNFLLYDEGNTDQCEH